MAEYLCDFNNLEEATTETTLVSHRRNFSLMLSDTLTFEAALMDRIEAIAAVSNLQAETATFSVNINHLHKFVNKQICSTDRQLSVQVQIS